MTDEATLERAKNNARLGRLMYHCETDAAGYPNGMPYWEEMSVGDKYHYCGVAVQMLEEAIREGAVIAVDSKAFGFRDPVMWGEGDCKALVEHLERVAPEELAAFEEKVARIQAAYKAHQDSKEAVDTSGEGKV